MSEWKPISRQQEKFLALPDSIKEAGFGGSAGPGKTECLIMLPILRQFIKLPGFKALFLRRNYTQLKMEVIPRAIRLYGPHGGKFNKGDSAFSFPEGGLIFYGHCEHETDMYNYDSMEINCFEPDELQSFLEIQYLYIAFSRVRSSNPKLPAIIRTSFMPGGIGHTWVRNRFIKPAIKGEKIIIGRGGNKRIFIFSTLADVAGKLPQYANEYGQSLDAMPEAERNAKKFGNWDSYEGQVFDEYRDMHYPNEPDNAIHVVPKFDIPAFWPRICSIDWGFAALTSVGFGAISPLRRLYVYRHLTFSRLKIEEWAPEVKFFIEREMISDIVICHSANQHRGQPHTILEQVSDALGTSIGLGGKDRVGGKALLHEYLRWKSKPVPPVEKVIFDNEYAQSLLRMGNLNEYKKYLEIFQEKPEETNIPKLQMFDNEGCKLIGDAIKSCIYDKTNKEDVAEFDGDDPYDMLRMMLHLVDSFFGEVTASQVELDKRNALVNSLKDNGDMTAYYRNARKLDLEAETDIALSRYNNRRGYYARSIRSH